MFTVRAVVPAIIAMWLLSHLTHIWFPSGLLGIKGSTGYERNLRKAGAITSIQYYGVAFCGLSSRFQICFELRFSKNQYKNRFGLLMPGYVTTKALKSCNSCWCQSPSRLGGFFADCWFNSEWVIETGVWSSRLILLDIWLPFLVRGWENLLVFGIAARMKFVYTRKLCNVDLCWWSVTRECDWLLPIEGPLSSRWPFIVDYSFLDIHDLDDGLQQNLQLNLFKLVPFDLSTRHSSSSANSRSVLALCR